MLANRVRIFFLLCFRILILHNIYPRLSNSGFHFQNFGEIDGCKLPFLIHWFEGDPNQNRRHPCPCKPCGIPSSPKKALVSSFISKWDGSSATSTCKILLNVFLMGGSFKVCCPFTLTHTLKMVLSKIVTLPDIKTC